MKNVVLCKEMTHHMLCLYRPVCDSSCSDGLNTSQHVHTSEDAERQPQPQAAVHGERMTLRLKNIWVEVHSVPICGPKLQRPAEKRCKAKFHPQINTL